MRKIRWGLLSTANINRRVIPAIQQSERGELTAVASRTLDSAVAYAREWEIEQAFASYDEMLNSGAIDAVYNPLPNHLHAEWSIKAMRAGKHVLCEKPFALTLAEVDEMISVQQETGMVLAEAFMYRHHPQTKIIGKLLQNGRLGDILTVRAIFNFKIAAGEKNIRLEPEAGGGSLWDVGVYPVSFSQFVMGKKLPTAVFGSQIIGQSGVDEAFAGMLLYENGVTAQISCSFQSTFHTHAEIIGTNGRLAATRPFVDVQEPASRLTFFPNDGEPEEIAIPEEYLYLGEVEDMHDAILNGQPSYLTLQETRQHVQTILALYQSANSGEIVMIG